MRLTRYDLGDLRPVATVRRGAGAARSDYVEKPDDTKLIEAAINGMLTSLDPHSYYLNPKTLREMQAQTSGGVRWPWARSDDGRRG